jgi:histone-lysine N-methyltransferase SETD3
LIYFLDLQQITPDNILPEIKSLLGDEVLNIAKLAIVILVEQKLGQVILFLLL